MIVAKTTSLDPNPDLRAELLAALAVLYPQIRGLEDLGHVSISGELASSVAAQLEAHVRRRDLIQATLDGLDAVLAQRDALAVDGYPETPLADIPINLFRELQGEMDDLVKAAAIFEAEPPPTATVALGEPTDKPEGD